MATPRLAEKSILQGRLEDLPLADIIQVLQVSAKSGALFLTRGDGTTAIVSFRNGNIVQALSTESYQTLGDRLIESGAIMRIDLQVALKYMARMPGMRVGDALVEQGAITRDLIEEEVRGQIAETIERLMNWKDAEFEFRLGIVSLGQGVPQHAADLVLDKGVEPRHLLLEASLIHDKRARESEQGTKRSEGAAPPPAEEKDEEIRGVIRWFDDGTGAPQSELEDPDTARTAGSYLSLSEELFVAQGRGEIGLLLLRYATELYSDGGLVMKDRTGFRVMGQFGEAFWWGERRVADPKMHFATGESPLFDMISVDGRPYVGLVAETAAGGLASSEPDNPGAVPAIAIPLTVLGRVSLILFCRNAVTSAPDARALIALARQVSVTLENLTLREIAKRPPPRPPAP